MRPSSRSSIHESTRQRLQNFDTKKIHILGNNLEQSDIDSIILPNNPQSKNNTNKIEVHIRCIFLRIGEIDTLNEKFNTEILLEASWETTGFKNLQTRSFDPAIDWTPKLELLNGLGQLDDDVSYTVRFIKSGLVLITEHHKLKGTLWERMELQHFPMDIQSLSILVTTTRSNSEMIFISNSKQLSGVYRQVFTGEEEWYLFEHVDINITEQIDKYLDNERNHSVVICSCYAARKYGYFMWNAYFLIFLITSASFTTFPIPLANIQGRAQIACTLLLTSITFRWSCNKFLPTISYLTALDVYAIGSIFSLCLLNIFHGVIGYVNYYVSINNNNNSSFSSRSVPSIVIIDRWALVTFTILFFAYQIGTFLWMYLIPMKKRRIMMKKDREIRLEITQRFQNTKATFRDVLIRAQQTLYRN